MYPTAPILAICWNRAATRAGAGRAARLALALTLALLLAPAAGVALAQSGYDEADAQAIDRMLMCPVCPAQTIDQTEVPLAQQMRAQVRELLASGATRREALDWFQERYGPGVLAEPPRSGYNLIAWIVPGVAVLAALAGGALALRAMRRRAGDGGDGGNGDVADEPDGLQPYLAIVDRELARDENNG